MDFEPLWEGGVRAQEQLAEARHVRRSPGMLGMGQERLREARRAGMRPWTARRRLAAGRGTWAEVCVCVEHAG